MKPSASTIHSAFVFCVVALCGAALSTAAWPATDSTTPRILSSDALRGDAALLRRTYETLHPGLHRYNTADEMDARFAALDRAFDHDQTVPEAFLALTRFTASVRCGHSYPNFSNQPRAIIDALTRGSNRVPFSFVWIDGTMVVTANHSGHAALVPGTLVDAIDGIPTATLLARLMPLARADGHNDAKRIDALQVRGLERFEAFDFYFPLVHPELGDSMTLTIRADARAAPSTLRVAGITHAQRVALMKRDDAAAADDPLGWRLAFPTRDVAVLRMPTWAAYNTTWDWKAWLRTTFETLEAKGATRLVIDLRGNEGGSSVGDEIAAHLVNRPLAGEDIVRRTRYRSVPDALRPFLDTWDKSFMDWGAAAIGPEPDGFYRLTKYDDGPEGSIVQPSPPRFRGQVDVLVDASNSSATFEFAKLVQSRHLGRLVGSPSGGNLRGINGGAFFFLRLPGSRIEVDVPLIGQFPLDDAPDRGLTPDVLLTVDAADIATGEDVVLRRALALPAAQRR